MDFPRPEPELRYESMRGWIENDKPAQIMSHSLPRSPLTTDADMPGVEHETECTKHHSIQDWIEAVENIQPGMRSPPDSLLATEVFDVGAHNRGYSNIQNWVDAIGPFQPSPQYLRPSPCPPDLGMRRKRKRPTTDPISESAYRTSFCSPFDNLESMTACSKSIAQARPPTVHAQPGFERNASDNTRGLQQGGDNNNNNIGERNSYIARQSRIFAAQSMLSVSSSRLSTDGPEKPAGTSTLR